MGGHHRGIFTEPEAGLPFSRPADNQAPGDAVGGLERAVCRSGSPSLALCGPCLDDVLYAGVMGDAGHRRPGSGIDNRFLRLRSGETGGFRPVRDRFRPLPERTPLRQVARLCENIRFGVGRSAERVHALRLEKPMLAYNRFRTAAATATVAPASCNNRFSERHTANSGSTPTADFRCIGPDEP